MNRLVLDYLKERGEINLRVHQKKTSLMPEDLNNAIIFETQIDYKRIYEDIKNYVVFKISITTNLNDRLAYLDVLDYMERIQLEAVRIKKRG
ncbi:MAG TPA: hypothetical protein DDW65_17810 [Firmicutes bacterium]|jgi:hypothetical protein|nr:hypothetical protein [Bacillota bacterium]